MKKYIFILLLIAFPLLSNAQADYNNSIGVRVAPSAGLTYKTFPTEKSAYEFILTTRWRGFAITGLYEYNQVAFGSDGWNFFYGVGAHAGFWEGPDNNPWFDEGDDYFLLGIDGIIGLEYTFDEVPFNISFDWKPAFNIITETGFWVDELAFSVRYVIN